MLHSNFIQLALFFAIFLEHLLKIRLVEKSKNPVRSLFQITTPFDPKKSSTYAVD